MSVVVSESSCTACPALKASIFPCAGPETLAAIANGKRTRTCRPGERIFSEGEPVESVYCVLSGDIELRRGLGSDEHRIGSATPGMLIGYRQPEVHGRYIVSAVARDEAVLCRIPLSLLQAQLGSAPSVMLALAKSLATRAEEIEERIVGGADSRSKAVG